MRKIFQVAWCVGVTLCLAWLTVRSLLLDRAASTLGENALLVNEVLFNAGRFDASQKEEQESIREDVIQLQILVAGLQQELPQPPGATE